MADTPEKLTIESSAQGILGKAITLRIIEKIRTRRAATAAVHNKNALPQYYRLLLKLIKNHSFTDVRETANKMMIGMHDGLQETHNVIIEEFLLLKEELLETIVFFRKYGGELNQEQLKLYNEFLEVNKNTLKQTNEYVNGIVSAARGHPTPLFGDIDRQVEAYVIKGELFPIRRYFEWFRERSLAKTTFKIEARMKKLEQRKKRSPSDIHQILKLNKEFSQKFEAIMKDMAIFTYIIVSYGLKGAVRIQEAASTAEYNLPPGYKEDFSDKMRVILDSEYAALKSIQKSINQLYDLIGKAERSLEEAKARVKKAVKV